MRDYFLGFLSLIVLLLVLSAANERSELKERMALCEEFHELAGDWDTKTNPDRALDDPLLAGEVHEARAELRLLVLACTLGEGAGG